MTCHVRGRGTCYALPTRVPAAPPRPRDVPAERFQLSGTVAVGKQETEPVPLRPTAQEPPREPGPRREAAPDALPGFGEPHLILGGDDVPHAGHSGRVVAVGPVGGFKGAGRPFEAPAAVLIP